LFNCSIGIHKVIVGGLDIVKDHVQDAK